MPWHQNMGVARSYLWATARVHSFTMYLTLFCFLSQKILNTSVFFFSQIFFLQSLIWKVSAILVVLKETGDTREWRQYRIELAKFATENIAQQVFVLVTKNIRYSQKCF